ncbi:unnamed protein product [Tuber melanosporum]|uniref:(Perigord truffle) hypothetical protein n=1 Tax=Tuber melanosporum (strain Mel28) TaxID=656061 RepID=D5GMH3_TUBMM|nr:uncharacterized protein GSTUM_00010729001 [Tuber melanosporum]CAZ85716.1 unnamed protein product [Tuber melanosporum]
MCTVRVLCTVWHFIQTEYSEFCSHGGASTGVLLVIVFIFPGSHPRGFSEFAGKIAALLCELDHTDHLGGELPTPALPIRHGVKQAFPPLRWDCGRVPDPGIYDTGFLPPNFSVDQKQN